jgi:hypothetical protein
MLTKNPRPDSGHLEPEACGESPGLRTGPQPPFLPATSSTSSATGPPTPDNEVRRNTLIIGLGTPVRSEGVGRPRHQVHKGHSRHSRRNLGDGVAAKQIKDNLCAYGPEHEELRQLAWIGMLILGDSHTERWCRGDHRLCRAAARRQAPRLRTATSTRSSSTSSPRNWQRLHAHFGDDLFHRLTSTSDRRGSTVAEQRRHVLSALATVASRYPSVAEMIRSEAASNSGLRQDRRFLLWAKDENRGDEEVLRALAMHLGKERIKRRQTSATPSSTATDGTSPDDTFRAVLLDPEAPAGRGTRTHREGGRLRSALPARCRICRRPPGH